MGKRKSWLVPVQFSIGTYVEVTCTAVPITATRQYLELKFLNNCLKYASIVRRTVTDIYSIEHKQLVDGKRYTYEYVDVRVLLRKRFGRN